VTPREMIFIIFCAKDIAWDLVERSTYPCGRRCLKELQSQLLNEAAQASSANNRIRPRL